MKLFVFSVNCISSVLLLLLLMLAKVNGSGLKDDTSGTLKFLELDKDYRIYQKRLSFSEALEFCSKCVGSFATFDTPAEANKVKDLIYKISVFSEAYDLGKEPNEWGLDRRYWFGLTDEKNESSWVWMKKPKDAGTPAVDVASYRWYAGQPDHIAAKTSEHCAGFWYSPLYIRSFATEFIIYKLFWELYTQKILQTINSVPSRN